MLNGPGVVIVVCSPGYRSSSIVVFNFVSVVICIVKISFSMNIKKNLISLHSKVAQDNCHRRAAVGIFVNLNKPWVSFFCCRTVSYILFITQINFCDLHRIWKRTYKCIVFVLILLRKIVILLLLFVNAQNASFTSRYYLIIFEAT